MFFVGQMWDRQWREPLSKSTAFTYFSSIIPLPSSIYSTNIFWVNYVQKFLPGLWIQKYTYRHTHIQSSGKTVKNSDRKPWLGLQRRELFARSFSKPSCPLRHESGKEEHFKQKKHTGKGSEVARTVSKRQQRVQAGSRGGLAHPWMPLVLWEKGNHWRSVEGQDRQHLPGHASEELILACPKFTSWSNTLNKCITFALARVCTHVRAYKKKKSSVVPYSKYIKAINRSFTGQLEKSVE